MTDETKIENVLLYEVRQNRKAINELTAKIAELDKDIFSNKIKLSIFIAGVTLFCNIIVIVVAKKVTTYFSI